MKHLTVKNSNRSYETQHPRSSRSARFKSSTERYSKITENDILTTSVEQKPSFDFRNKSFILYYQQELSKADKALDSWEIEQKRFSSTEAKIQAYVSYLESVSMILKQKDPEVSSCVIRGLLGIKSVLKLLPVKADKKIKSPENVKKAFRTTRENLTQTHELHENEESYQDTYREISYIKDLISRVDDLKSPKIIQKLYDLHDNLCKMQTDIPTPTKTPEPHETTIGTMGQKLNFTIKVIKNEIKRNLSLHNIEFQKLHKSTQVEFKENEIIMQMLHEKDQMIFKLQRTQKVLEAELKTCKENINSLRAYSNDTERKHNDVKIELIQVQNKLDSTKDASKSLKHKMFQVSEKLSNKKRKLTEARKELSEIRPELAEKTTMLKQSKHELMNESIKCKMAEEKLEQIGSAWKENHGASFKFKHVSSIEISKKYGLYQEVEEEPKSGKRLNVVNLSPKVSPKSPKLHRNSLISLTSSFDGAMLKSLVHRNFTLNHTQEDINIERIPEIIDEGVNNVRSGDKSNREKKREVVKNNSNGLIESKILLDLANPNELKEPIDPIATKKDGSIMESLQFTEGENRWGNDYMISLNKPIENPNPLNLIDGQNTFKTKRPSQSLAVNLIKEQTEAISSPESPSINKPRPILETILLEQDILTSSNKAKAENIPEVKKALNRSGTLNTNHKFVDFEVFDEETFLNLKRICENSGIQIEFDNLPQYLKLDLLKSLEGHDSRKCYGVCKHLRRAANIRFKVKGIPYPIKRPIINPKID